MVVISYKNVWDNVLAERQALFFIVAASVNLQPCWRTKKNGCSDEFP